MDATDVIDAIDAPLDARDASPALVVPAAAYEPPTRPAFRPAIRPAGRTLFREVEAPRLPGVLVHEGRDVVDRFEEHEHEPYDIVLVEAGARHLARRGARTVLGPGEVFVTASGERHSGRAVETGWSFRSLYLPAPLLAEAAVELRGGRAPGAGAPAPAPALRHPALAAQLRAACAAMQQPGAALEQQSRLLGVLLELLRPGDVEGALPRVGPEPRSIARVEEYLREHLTADVTLDELAAVAELSKFHLLRAFRAHRGLTPHGLQRRYRVGVAKALLWRGVPLAQVARQAGFYDQSHLTNAFRGATGLTPARFQRLRGGRAAGGRGRNLA